MSDFFKPWHRKSGVVTLAMACAFVAGWVRSDSDRDAVVISIGNLDLVSNSYKGRIAYSAVLSFAISSTRPSPIKFHSEPIDGAFYCGLWVVGNTRRGIALVDGQIHHISIALPLALLTAYLLLSSQRQTSPVNGSESKPDEAP